MKKAIFGVAVSSCVLLFSFSPVFAATSNLQPGTSPQVAEAQQYAASGKSILASSGAGPAARALSSPGSNFKIQPKRTPGSGWTEEINSSFSDVGQMVY